MESYCELKDLHALYSAGSLNHQVLSDAARSVKYEVILRHKRLVTSL